jgi:tRNA(Ser,Leu) C12 N-acetylase TAN1
MANKYIVKYILDDDPRNQEAILLAENKEEAEKQIYDEFTGFADYVKIVSIDSQTTLSNLRKNAENFFIKY